VRRERFDNKPTLSRSLFEDTETIPSVSASASVVFLARLEPPLPISQSTGRKLAAALKAPKVSSDRPLNEKGKTRSNDKENDQFGLVDLIVSEAGLWSVFGR
jgi:hypothetical protein